MWRFTCCSSHFAVWSASPPSSRASTSRTARRDRRWLCACRARDEPTGLARVRRTPHCCAAPGRGRGRGCLRVYLFEQMEGDCGAVHLGRLPPHRHAEEDEQHVEEHHLRPRDSRQGRRPHPPRSLRVCIGLVPVRCWVLRRRLLLDAGTRMLSAAVCHGLPRTEGKQGVYGTRRCVLRLYSYKRGVNASKHAGRA